MEYNSNCYYTVVVRHLMKTLKYILIFGILIYSCQSNRDGYAINERNEIITKDKCKIPISYPEISGLADREKTNKLNKILKEFPEHEYYARKCENNGKSNVKGDYQILLQNDSILSIEFRTLIERQNKKVDTVYHSIVLNPKAKDTNEIGIVGIEPNEIIPNYERGKIYPYVKKYSVENNDYINLLAYETGSNYVITWAVSDKDFIIYVGGEGEWFGNNRIKIPLNELK